MSSGERASTARPGECPPRHALIYLARRMQMFLYDSIFEVVPHVGVKEGVVFRQLGRAAAGQVPPVLTLLDPLRQAIPPREGHGFSLRRWVLSTHFPVSQLSVRAVPARTEEKALPH